MARVNILCLVGAFVGLFSIMMPWMVVVYPQHMEGDVLVNARTEEWQFADVLGGYWDSESAAYSNELVMAFSFVFLGGMVASFFTPIGGAAQLAGVVGTWYFAERDLVLDSLGWGIRLALIAGIVVLISYYIPTLSIGYVQRPFARRNRAKTFVLRRE
ncbi:MAG: hypothetical protein ACUVT7_02550 [Thermoplasmata archaeon]